MLALIAAILIGAYAFGADPGWVNLLYLGLAFWALHFRVRHRPAQLAQPRLRS